MTPLETFKASHKRITNYYDILEGGYEQALDSYNLGEVKAVHVYDGDLFIIERFQVGNLSAFDLVLCNYSWAERTLAEVEPKLYEFWLENVHDAPTFTLEDAAEHPDRYTRGELRRMLQRNDRNGEYEDATYEECVALVKDVMDNQVRKGTA